MAPGTAIGIWAVILSGLLPFIGLPGWLATALIAPMLLITADWDLVWVTAIILACVETVRTAQTPSND